LKACFLTKQVRGSRPTIIIRSFLDLESALFC
jgi:hypothetical protein